MGHAIRSRVILDHLVAVGHDVEIMASSRAADFLSSRYSGVHRIHGMHIIVEKNRVRKDHTLWSNILDGRAAIPKQIKSYFELVEHFMPEVVISDFESWTYLYAKLHHIPVLSIDNMQIINRCSHRDAILKDESKNFKLTKTFIKAKLPRCDHYFITTFFYPEIRKKRTSLHPCILRDEILKAKIKRGDHLLIYQTSEGHEALVNALLQTGLECRIYGMKRNIDADHVEGNLCYRPFSENRFIEDLASARAVIAGGGFTTMGECVYLHKPLLAIPISGQFEQALNARYLDSEGYGRWAEEITEDVLSEFIKDIPKCEERLASYSQDGNKDILLAIDEQLDKTAARL